MTNIPQENVISSIHGNSPKLLLLDDDPVFRSLMINLGLDQNLDIEAYESLQEVERFPNGLSYQGVILDFHLAETTAPQLIMGLDSFFEEIPTLLVSADSNAQLALEESSYLKAFVSKSEGGRKILEAMKTLMARQTE